MTIQHNTNKIIHYMDGTTKVLGKVTGKLHEGNQVPGIPGAICHACGLGYKCSDPDCPCTKLNPYSDYKYEEYNETLYYRLTEKVTDIMEFAYKIWDYEVGEGKQKWYTDLPDQTKNMYRAKAVALLEWLEANPKNK